MAVRHVLAAVLCSSAAVSAHAQDITAQSLLDKNLEARGGAQALAAIKAIQFNGKMIFPGDFELAYGEIRARGDHGIEARMEGNVQGLTYMTWSTCGCSPSSKSSVPGRYSAMVAKESRR